MIKNQFCLIGLALLASIGISTAFADSTPPSPSECQAAIQAKPSNSAETAALLDQCVQYNVCSQLDDAIPNCNSVLGSKDFMANYLSNPVLQSSSSFHASYSGNTQNNNNNANVSANPNPSDNASAQAVTPDPYTDNNVVILKTKKPSDNNNNIHWY